MIETIRTILLVIHIAAGTVALLTALASVVSAKGATFHIRAGRIFTIGMAMIFLTAVPLAVLGADIFLLLIAVFSFYLAFAGWRFARNRRRQPHPVDWAAAGILALTGLAMWGYGGYLASTGDTQWVTMLVFGGIAAALATADGRFHRRPPRGQVRIRRHLTNMLAGTIATITAVAVVNVDLNPVWLPWILPTVVITPVIVWWNIRIVRQEKQQAAARSAR